MVGVLPEDQFEYSVTRILSFFVNLLEKKLSYSTLNTYRAAISLIMDNELGKDIKISRLFRAIAIEKPQLPKYSAIYDPQLVLVYLESLYPNKEISVPNLTEKLVILRALLTAQSVQTISLIKIENILISENLIQIKIPDRIKISDLNRIQPILNIPFLNPLTTKNYIFFTYIQASFL